MKQISLSPNIKKPLIIGSVLILSLLILGVVLDIRSFDQTRGGYEPPYTNYTGEPVDWSVVESTPYGMFKPGYVIDVYVNCTTGMMHMGVIGIKIQFRKFSPRALAVHKPREACMERGFDPEF